MPAYCDCLLSAAVILTQDEERRVLERAALAIDHGRIVALGTMDELAAQWRAARRLDLGEALVLPGLINAHTHAAMTFLRGLADDLPLMKWLTEYIFPVERHLTAELVELGALLGFAEMLRTGTTACMDMYIIEEAVFRAAGKAGLRCRGGEGVFGFSSAGAQNFSEALRKTEALSRRFAGHARLGTAVMPHALYTTDPEIWACCRDMAQRHDFPLHIHLAETPAETAQCCSQWGKRPLELCREAGLLSARTTLAHVVDVTEEELDILAASAAVPVHNPSSNMKLASGIAPVVAMLRRGIPVALGSDGAASNNRLNMYTEMGRAALLHKVAQGDPTALPANSVLDMATRGGAAALHWPELGRLEVGGPADLTALDLSSPNLQPLYAPVSSVVYAATGMETLLTMVEGEILYHNGCFSRFDYPELCRELHTLQRWVLHKAGRA